MFKISLILGSVYGLTGIILGAFGAHALKSKLSIESLESFHTGTRYQMYHALFLILLGMLQMKSDSSWLTASTYLTAIGVVLFSGSIYLLSVFQLKWLGPVTPIGGLCLIIAWGLLLMHVFRNM